MFKSALQLKKAYNKFIVNASKRHPPEMIRLLKIPGIEHISAKVSTAELCRLEEAYNRKYVLRQIMDMRKRYRNLRELYKRDHPKEYETTYRKILCNPRLIQLPKGNHDPILKEKRRKEFNVAMKVLSVIELGLRMQKGIKIPAKLVGKMEPGLRPEIPEFFKK